MPERGATWLALAYLVVLGSGPVFVLYVVVVRLWGASRAAYSFVVIPLVTVLLSAWIDDEPIGAALLLGGPLVLVGVYIGALRPAATPSLIVGIRQAWSFAWHALIGAEILIAASVGLGHILLVGREFQLMDQIIAAMITIFTIGFVFDRLIFYRLEDKVRAKWGLKQSKEL